MASDLLLQTRRNPLEVFFAPRSVALIGASEQPGSVGRTVLRNLVTNPFGGTVYPVNPAHSTVLGIKAYPGVAAVPNRIDLAVVATPAQTVPGVIRECAQAGVKGAIILSAGFKETGAKGLRLEEEVREAARAGHVRILGPNCLGMMCPHSGLNATFAGAMARPGNVAFLSQSGALLTAILDWSLQENVGFSAFASLGSMLDVNFGDLIDYLGQDPHTKSILVYMESIGDARAFLSAARMAALSKPIIVLKAGRTAEAARAATSHTGALASSDEVLTAAFRRTGVLRVDSIADLFYMADALAKQPRPAGPRLTILTNAGGPAVLATDALVSGGGQLAALSDKTRESFDALLPLPWSHGNPVDILGDADPDRYARSLQVAGDDPDSDGLLVILTPQDATQPTQTAERLKSYAHRNATRPLIASWMGGIDVGEGRRILSDAGIPTFQYPDTAARIFNYMWKYSYNLRGLYETPSLDEHATSAADRQAARDRLRAIRAEGRTLLTELESKRLLSAYGIPSVETRHAASVDEAMREADSIGYPVVLKLHSRTITHKSEVDGVQLDLVDRAAVRAAFARIRRGVEEAGHPGAFDGVTVQRMIPRGGYELIIGSATDVQFGPVLLFGSGGTLVEVYNDRSLGLPPLNTTLARRMMERTKVFQALRGRVDLDALEKLLVRFSQLILEERTIKEIDINPLLASRTQLLALDARVVLHDPAIPEDALPRPAIRPYPAQYVETVTLRGGELVTIRPIRPEDEPDLVRFHQTLSAESVFLRYAGTIKLDTRVAHERLARICFIDYDREMALIVERASPGGGAPELIAVGRLLRTPLSGEAEFALSVSDTCQGRGIGKELLTRLIAVGRDWGLDRIFAEILGENQRMLRICRELGFRWEPAAMVHAVKLLGAARPEA
jgi:acetyltransferase